jgi:hypothetical protein
MLGGTQSLPNSRSVLHSPETAVEGTNEPSYDAGACDTQCLQRDKGTHPKAPS